MTLDPFQDYEDAEKQRQEEAAELRALENARMREQTAAQATAEGQVSEQPIEEQNNDLQQLPSNTMELLETQAGIQETAQLREQEVTDARSEFEEGGTRSQDYDFEQLTHDDLLEPHVQIVEYESDDEGSVSCIVKLLN